MLCSQINHKMFIHSPTTILQRISNPQRLSRIQQTVSLENKAYVNLCELSKTICQEQMDQNQQKQKFKKQKYSFSPWKWKNRYHSQSSEPDKATKICILKHKTENKAEKLQNIESNNKQHSFMHRQSLKKSQKIKRYPSIYLRLLKAKQIKSLFKIKKSDPQIELITCMMKNKTQQNKQDKSQNQNLNKLMRHETAKELIRRSSIKYKSDSRNRSRQSAKVTLHQFSCENILEPVNNQPQHSQKRQLELQKQHWKVKVHSKKYKQLAKNQVQNRYHRTKESIQNISLSKKGSVKIQREKKQNYHINHPLTRVLYERYINTINVSYPNKGSKIKF